MAQESYKPSPLGWFRNTLQSGSERRSPIDLSCIQHDPLSKLFDREQIQIDTKAQLNNAQAGDVFVVYENRPHLAVATEQVIGNRRVFYRAIPHSERTTYLDLTDATRTVRIAQQTNLPIPELEQNPPSPPATSAESYLAQLPTSDELARFRFHCTEQFANIFHKSTEVQAITSLDEIKFNPRTGELPHEYLYVTNKGVPIFLSDFHQKLATHIAYLIATESLPNQRPVVTWIDKHPDDVFGRNNLQNLPTKQFMLKGIDRCVDQVDCGQAASFLMHTGLATISGPQGLNTLGAPATAFAYPALNYRQPFARTHRRPHVVSFDLDQLPFFCDKDYNKYVGDFIGLEPTTTQSYFDWLAQAGLNPTHVDAVCAYTSPGYIEPLYAMDGFKYLVAMFE